MVGPPRATAVSKKGRHRELLIVGVGGGANQCRGMGRSDQCRQTNTHDSCSSDIAIDVSWFTPLTGNNDGAHDSAAATR